MILTKTKLLNTKKLGDKILEYSYTDNNVSFNGELITDVSSYLFNPEKYPFDISFDELQCEINDTVLFNEIEETISILGEKFVKTYVEYIENELNIRYKECIENEVK